MCNLYLAQVEEIAKALYLPLAAFVDSFAEQLLLVDYEPAEQQYFPHAVFSCNFETHRGRANWHIYRASSAYIFLGQPRVVVLVAHVALPSYAPLRRSLVAK